MTDTLKARIRHVPDFPKAGIRFYDVTTLLRDPGARWNHPPLTQVVRGPAATRVTGYTRRNERWRYTEWPGGTHDTEPSDEDDATHRRRHLA